MIFTLNGGPGDGQKVEVGDKHTDGRTVRFVLVNEEKAYIYVCPSEDDFLERQLFLTFLEEQLPPSPHREPYKSLAKKVMGDDIADWLYDPTSKSWNDWKSQTTKVLPEKKYKKRDTLSHEQWEHLPVKSKPSPKSNDFRSGRNIGPDNGPERKPQGKSRRLPSDGERRYRESDYPRQTPEGEEKG